MFCCYNLVNTGIITILQLYYYTNRNTQLGESKIMIHGVAGGERGEEIG